MQTVFWVLICLITMATIFMFFSLFIPQFLCPAKNQLKKMGYRVKYLGPQFIEGVSVYDYYDHLASPEDPDVWAVSKDGLVISWIIKMKKKIFYKIIQPDQNQPFIDIMVAVGATKVPLKYVTQINTSR